jgi:crossover junction endodeoxyribonuclease RuvC
MRILGIDPGYGIVGFGVVQRLSSSKFQYVASGSIKTSTGDVFAARLDEIHRDMCAIIDQHKPDVCAIEKLYFAQNTTTGLQVAEARGVITQCLHSKGVRIVEYSPSQVKMAVTGQGRAKKAQVKEMVELLLNRKGIKGPDDTLDALAIALSYTELAS